MLILFFIIFAFLLFFFLDLEGVFLSDSKQTQARIASSPNFKNGRAQNWESTEILTQENLAPNEEKPSWLSIIATQKKVHIPSVKNNLQNLLQKESFVWLGHSSYLLYVGGKTILVDPVLNDNAAPLPLIISAFDGADIYSVQDLPDVDFLIITHNHYDHLSRKTLRQLASKIKNAIAPLGVGKYLKAWGVAESTITELDWNESASLDNFTFHALTARHFSGRGLTDRNKTLWASFLIESPKNKIFIGGDSGYGAHFKAIGERFGKIDWAFLENGQFNKRWALIHAFPSETLQIATELNAKKIMTVHNAKFRLAPHEWQQPLEEIYTLYQKGNFGFSLVTPKIGEIVPLSADSAKFKHPWWRENPR